MAQRSKVITGIVTASMMFMSLINMPKSNASTQEVFGAMQIFRLDHSAPLTFNSIYASQTPPGLIDCENGASRDFMNEIDRALAKVPPHVLRALAHAGYHVTCSPSLVDAVPAARNQQVRGYQAHSTWDTVYGMFNRTTKRVVMAEKAMQPDGTGNLSMVPLRNQQRRQGILRHEFGHAVDQYLGNFSHNPEFVAAYNKGLRSISSYEAKTLSYYLQPGDAGREETFAEIFAALNESACDPNSDILLKNHFPELVQLIRTRVQKISA